MTVQKTLESAVHIGLCWFLVKCKYYYYDSLDNYNFPSANGIVGENLAYYYSLKTSPEIIVIKGHSQENS